jgi:hypothetical protein
MATFLSVLIASITLCLVADDDKPAPAKKVVVEKTGPKDWPKDARGIPIPPKDWITVESFTRVKSKGDGADRERAVIRIKGETKSRTVKSGTVLAKGVKVSTVNPLGLVSVRVNDRLLVQFYQPGREELIKARGAATRKEWDRYHRQKEWIKRIND